MPEAQVTRYARNGELHIAYQVTGEGPRDLLYSTGFLSHIEHGWELPAAARFTQHLGRFARVIRFDRRGIGLSDRLTGLATLEERVEDIGVVLDAAGSDRTALLGVHEGGPVSAYFAASFPERVSALVLYGSFARQTITDDYPWGMPDAGVDAMAQYLEAIWGQEGMSVTPGSLGADDPHYKRWLARLQRLACSPREAGLLMRNAAAIDIRPILGTITVPTLVLHRRDDPFCSIDHGRYLAEHISGAKLVELDGADHLPFLGDSEAVIAEVEEFLTGVRGTVERDRVLATVLFTDIVGSTERAVAMGDRPWRDLLDRHHHVVRQALERFRGVEVDTAGDGFFATFDGPAAAIRCANAIAESVRDLGIEIRAGVHTGEVERRGHGVSGVSVHVGARIAAAAEASDVLVSKASADLVAGSGIEFEDRGVRTLKGVPGEWNLLKVSGV